MTNKDLRIKKLYQKGLSIEQISRKIGYGDSEAGIERVKQSLKINN